MVQKSEKFFIFSWKELTVIALLGAISITFFFTLGLHYGKKIYIESSESKESIGKLEGSSESLPAKDTLETASRHALVATEDSIKSATQEELQKEGVKLEAPKQVDLPSSKTTSKVTSKITAKAVAVMDEGSTTHHKGVYSIQLGSFPSRGDAASHEKTYEKNGVKSEIKVAIVGGITRYRVVVPGFATKKSADAKAKELKGKKKINSFVIIKNE